MEPIIPRPFREFNLADPLSDIESRYRLATCSRNLNNRGYALLPSRENEEWSNLRRKEDQEMSGYMVAANSANLEAAKIWVPFVGALLGAAIGNPVVEWIKDKIGASRQWQNQRNEIVSTLRLLLGILGAFHNIRLAAFMKPSTNFKPSAGFETILAVINIHFTRLKDFDFALFTGSLAKLSALHPEESRKAAAGQRLIQELIAVRSCFQHLLKLKPLPGAPSEEGISRDILSRDDQVFLHVSDNQYLRLTTFLIKVYAPRMGIDPMSIIFDSEIVKFDKEMSQVLLSELQSQSAEMNELLQKLGDPAAKRTGELPTEPDRSGSAK